MAHFAILDDSNVVTSVVVVANEDCLDSDGKESEAVGIAFCTNLFGAGTYVQTSYNGTTRQMMATIGGTYDASKDKFIAPKPFASWVLNSGDVWVAPTPLPADAIANDGDHKYCWNEENYQADNTNGWEDLGT
jgi:hypothetical protein